MILCRIVKMRTLILIILGLSFVICVKCHSHSHSEPPHFKYSKEANQPKAEEDHDGIDPEEHSHEGHGHSHDGHGHSHGGHGHSHEKQPEPSSKIIPEKSHETHSHTHESHGHSHGDHGHSHGSHGHSHEKQPEPSSKIIPEKSHETHSHTHESHSHGDHGHSHEGHGHSHEGHGHSHEGHGHSHDTKQAQPNKATSKGNALIDSMWLRAIVATGLISAAPVIILWFIPLDNSQKHNAFLKVLLSFASGGLLGDAFLHLIPHAIDPHDPNPSDPSHSHSHSAEGHSHDHSKNMQVGLWVVAGIMCFLCVEKFVRFVKGGHTHSHAAPVTDSKSGDKGDKKKKDVKPKKTEDIKVAGYLNLAADFAHNFTDGLAIGASFLVSDSIGIVTTITILFHEIPHEIGDFAILIQSGCSKRRAMLLQLTTAIGAMMGTLCSLLAQGAGQAATAWILPFTAGGFIYIATVSVIPELLEDSKPFQSVKEIFAMIVGVAMMIVIAFYE